MGVIHISLNSKFGESQNLIEVEYLVYLSIVTFSYISNIIGMIRHRFLLRFNLFFWDEINKNYANLEPDPIF